MATQILFYSPKGGVAKTTSIVSLAGELSKNHNKRVLLIDCDANVNLSGCLKLKCSPAKPLTRLCSDWALYDEEGDVHEAIAETAFPNLDIMPSTEKSTAGAVNALSSCDEGDQAFEVLLSEIEDEYDFIFYDAAGSEPTALIRNALRIADYQLIPFDASKEALKAVGSAIRIVQQAKSVNPSIEVLGAFLTNAENNGNTKDIAEAAEELLGDYLLPIRIRNSVDIKYANRRLEPVCYYNKNGNPAEDYAELAKYILNLIEMEE